MSESLLIVKANIYNYIKENITRKTYINYLSFLQFSESLRDYWKDENKKDYSWLMLNRITMMIMSLLYIYHQSNDYTDCEDIEDNESEDIIFENNIKQDILNVVNDYMDQRILNYDKECSLNDNINEATLQFKKFMVFYKQLRKLQKKCNKKINSLSDNIDFSLLTQNTLEYFNSFGKNQSGIKYYNDEYIDCLRVVFNYCVKYSCNIKESLFLTSDEYFLEHMYLYGDSQFDFEGEGHDPNDYFNDDDSDKDESDSDDI